MALRAIAENIVPIHSYKRAHIELPPHAPALSSSCHLPPDLALCPWVAGAIEPSVPFFFASRAIYKQYMDAATHSHTLSLLFHRHTVTFVRSLGMPARATRYLLFTTKVQQKEIVPVPSPIRMARRFARWSDEASTKRSKKGRRPTGQMVHN